MVIKHNMSTQFATRHLNIAEDVKGQATERLTTGYRINKAADSAASMVVWESIRNQVRGLNQAGRNSQDGQGFINTADSGMNELTSILHRMKELCVQGANDTNTAEDREDIQMEIDALNNEINRIAEETEFNKIKIFKDPGTDPDNAGSPDGNGVEGSREFVFQVGANSKQLVSTRLPVFNTKILGTEGINVSDSVNATSGLAVLDKSLDIVDLERSRLGAVSNRLEHAYANSANASENSQTSEATIRDTDIADEAIAYATADIIQQADIAMIAQANGERETILAMVL